MIISRLGDQWKREWVDEVQGLLDRDAGWGWKGFWECVRKNLDVRLFILLPHFSKSITVLSFPLSSYMRQSTRQHSLFQVIYIATHDSG